MRIRLGCLLPLLLLGCSVGLASSPVQIRFYPASALRIYEVDARHGLNSAFLQNISLVNESDQTVSLERMEIELLDGEAAVQTHRLSKADLEKAAQRGVMLQKAGLLEKLAFQFRPDVLLGKGVALSNSPHLEPHSALLVGHRYFVFAGVPARLRVRAYGQGGDGASVEAEASLPIVAATSNVEYNFPLSGCWFIGTGQALHDAHRWVVPEEFALDIARLGGDGLSHRGTGSKRTEFYAYGQNVLAAADGTVVAVENSIPETDSNLRQKGESAEAYTQRVLAQQDQLLAKGMLYAAGNYVVLQHTPHEFSFYAHLMPGSVRVHPGEAVKQGQVIGRLGHSGNSTEPHLHFQVTDGADPLFSAGIPVRFKNIRLPFADGDRAVQSGDVVETTN
jgi:murein DD-endopeptidase MepM/ murein hydrolase activator NlpD